MQLRRIAVRLILFSCIVANSAMAQEAIQLTLQTALSFAEQNNPGLKAAGGEIDAARGRGWTTWWFANPEISVEWEGIPEGEGLDKFGSRKIAFSQEAEFPLNMYWRNRLANRNVQISEKHFDESRLELRAEVIRGYYDYLAARDGLVLARERVELARQFVDKVEIRRRVGEAPAIEAVRAGVELAQAQNQLQEKQSALKAAAARLNSTLGHTAQSGLIVADSLRYQPVDVSLQEVRQHARNNHPLLLESQLWVDAAGISRNLAWGSLLPDFKVSLFRQNIGGDPDFYGAEIGLQIPLWFVFRQRGEIQQAGATLAIQKNLHSAERLKLLTEIDEAYAHFHAAKKQLENFRATLLQQADEVYRIALRSYEQGEVGYLQLLEAQKTLIEVRQSYIDALARYYTALAALEKAGAVTLIN